MSNPWKKFTITRNGETATYEARKADDGDAAVFNTTLTYAVGTNLDTALYARQLDMREFEGNMYAAPVADPEAKNPGFRFVVKGPVPPHVVVGVFRAMQGPKD